MESPFENAEEHQVYLSSNLKQEITQRFYDNLLETPSPNHSSLKVTEEPTL